MEKEKPKKGNKKKSVKVYTFEVFLLEAPVTEAFAKENPEVSRTIQILGNQTLEKLHDVIFKAFDREDDHLYEFQLGNELHDPDGSCYVLPIDLESPFSEDKNIAGDVTKTKIDSLNLVVEQSFGYWFDFGDDWMHQINVISIDDKTPEGKYPRITERIGDSPPQYTDWDEEEE